MSQKLMHEMFDLLADRKADRDTAISVCVQLAASLIAGSNNPDGYFDGAIKHLEHARQVLKSEAMN